MGQVIAPPHTMESETNFGLTPRELGIIRVILAGYTNEEIAQRFSMTTQTVKDDIHNIFQKLGVFDRLELALFAVCHLLVRESSPGLPKKPDRLATSHITRTSAKPQ